MTTRFLTGNSDQPRALTLVRPNTHPDAWFEDIYDIVRLHESRVRIVAQPYACTDNGECVEYDGISSTSEYLRDNELTHVAMRLRFYTTQEAFAFKMKYG